MSVDEKDFVRRAISVDGYEMGQTADGRLWMRNACPGGWAVDRESGFDYLKHIGEWESAGMIECDPRWQPQPSDPMPDHPGDANEMIGDPVHALSPFDQALRDGWRDAEKDKPSEHESVECVTADCAFVFEAHWARPEQWGSSGGWMSDGAGGVPVVLWRPLTPNPLLAPNEAIK